MSKSEGCGGCKVICAECKNYYHSVYHMPLTDIQNDYCRAYQTTKTDCVTGNISSNYDRCDVHNVDGNCKKFEEDKNAVIRRKLICALHEYNKTQYCGNTIDAYIRQLLLGLEGHEMRHMCYFTKGERMKKYKCQKYD